MRAAEQDVFPAQGGCDHPVVISIARPDVRQNERFERRRAPYTIKSPFFAKKRISYSSGTAHHYLYER